MFTNYNPVQFFKKQNIIGVVGGMGPESGIFLCNQIVTQTEANSDQEHFSFVLMSLPNLIGDRSAFIAGQIQKNPAFEIVNIIEKLEAVGATIIGIPCNTSHSPEIFDVILKELTKKNSKVKLLNMPMETCNDLQENFPEIKRVGLMTTNGTFRSGIYENKLKKMGYDVILPDFEFQNSIIHRCVYDPLIGIKANPGKCSNEAKILLDKAIEFFEENLVHAIILGCTEFSLVSMSSKKGIVFIDSSKSLAKALLREAKMVYEPA